MSKMLLINPRRRRRASAAPKRRRTSARRRRNPIAVRSVAARRAPFALSRRRRRNPISNLRIGRRRRRNPIGGSLGLNSRSLMAMFKDAAIGGAGALTMDVIMGQVNAYLPTSMQTVKGQLSMGDAVKAGLTALLGQALSKSTKGLSRRMAAGALTVQAYDVMGAFMPDTMTVGFASPARIVNGSARVGPTRGGMLQAYMKPGRTALLNAYQKPGQTAVLNRAPTAQQREGVTLFK